MKTSKTFQVLQTISFSPFAEDGLSAKEIIEYRYCCPMDGNYQTIFVNTVNSTFNETGGTWLFISLMAKFAVRICKKVFH